jgi:hypothetical protein
MSATKQKTTLRGNIVALSKRHRTGSHTMLTFQLLGAAFILLGLAPLVCGRTHALSRMRRHD